MISTAQLAGFAELYERHYETVFRAALRVTGNPADAEDVLQTVFLRVLSRSEQDDAAGRPAAYFRRAAVNAAVDLLRRRTVHAETAYDDSAPHAAVDRRCYAGVFQFFYLRLAVFFGCLGMFMYLLSGEMSNRTLHYWFLAPAPREAVLLGKYTAGLIASTAIFAGGALLVFAVMISYRFCRRSASSTTCSRSARSPRQSTTARRF
jgi:RNA polymerase sigma factor (sigma-70 family)